MTTDQTTIISGHPVHPVRLEALRGVAVLEFLKGALVLIAAIGLYWIDPSDVAEAFLGFLHISPDHHFAHLLFLLADKLSDIKFWHVMVGASCYSGLRFAESYGLWRARAWAEWIALISGAIYLPVEIKLLARQITLIHAGVFVVNVAIVLFMFYLRIYLPHQEKRSSMTQD